MGGGGEGRGVVHLIAILFPDWWPGLSAVTVIGCLNTRVINKLGCLLHQQLYDRTVKFGELHIFGDLKPFGDKFGRPLN